MDRQLLKGSTEMLILASLTDEPKHGYLIASYLRNHSDDTFTFSAGMLYPLLHKLEKQKLIRGKWEQGSGTRKRKFYTLTKKGASYLSEKKKEWRQFSNFITQVIRA